MISQEFRSAIANQNLLRTRIMLKDSFVVDPTFRQLEEMLAYAKQNMPGLLVPFDEDTLEEDPAKWDQEVMNMELVQLVNNFSETRIEHLQKVISKVIAPKKSQLQFTCQPPKKNPVTSQKKQHSSNPIHSHTAMNVSKQEYLRKEALQIVMNEGAKISNVLQKVKDTGKWKLSQINELEKSAKQLFQATQTYKANTKNK